ncbi:MAG TPA: hypothetical protein DC017_06060 [Candidatus Wallbacteria bacterium]|nr:hypothetical protein [Candidatus Wallbacteria bacterium]
MIMINKQLNININANALHSGRSRAKGRGFSARGITLSELLVAISIAGVVMMAAYAIFSSSIRQFTDGINQLEAQRNGRRIISFMRKKLSSAVSGLKASDIGEKAPTGLSTGIELCVIPEDGVTKLNDSDLFYKAVTETYYLSEGRIMFKDDNNHQPRKVFDSVKSIYFKIFTLKRGPSSVPAVLVTVNTFCGSQNASYESMVTPVFIGGLKSAESMILPIVNSYALESAN